MEANKEFFDESEKICWEKLKEFNEHTHIFNHIERTIGKHHSDATGYTTNRLGETRYFNIELKNRNLNTLDNNRISGETEHGCYTGSTVIIESHKVASLLLDNIIGLEPLYINFMQDGSTLIFNLNKLSKRPLESDTKNILSKGYNKFEMAKRQKLFVKDAAIYDKDYKLIKRAGE